MQPNNFSLTIPGGNCFEIKGVSNATARQRFTAFIPKHERVGLVPIHVGDRKEEVLSVQAGDNVPMNPSVIKDDTTDALRIEIEFLKLQGNAWVCNLDWKEHSREASKVIVGQEDGSDADYNDTMVTIEWHACIG